MSLINETYSSINTMLDIIDNIFVELLLFLYESQQKLSLMIIITALKRNYHFMNTMMPTRQIHFIIRNTFD